MTVPALEDPTVGETFTAAQLDGHIAVLAERVFQVETKWPHFRLLLRDVRRLLENAGLTPVIETGARYFLDPLRKHRPTLISVD